MRRFGIASLLPFQFSCGYRSTDNRIGLYGRGTSHAYDWTVVEVGGAMQVTTPQGVQYLLALEADGAYRMRAGRSGALGWEARKTASGRTLRFANGTEYDFAPPGFLNRVRDANGNQLVFELNYAGYPVSVTDGAGRKYTFTRAGALIGSIVDPLGRSISFDYDGNQRLVAQTDAGGNTTRYEYDGAGRIAKKTDPRGAVWSFEYDAAGRTIRETLPEGGEMRYAYTVSGGTVTETRMTDARGNVTTYRFNGQGFPVKVVDALGGVATQQYDASTNLLLSETDPLGRITRYTYDALGNRSSVKDALGRFTLIDYDPLFNKPTTIKDALGNTTTSIYDAKGNLASSTNGEGETTRYTYTPQGQLQTATDPLGRVTRYDYDAEGNLIRTSDALGNATDLTYDTANRLAVATTPRGETHRYGYDALDRLTQRTDALSGVTGFVFDANDNLLALTDPLGHTVETNVYDLRNRVTRKTDAKGKNVAYQYDPNDNLSQVIDRRGRGTTFEYDALNRPTKAADADGRVTQYYYDLAGNMSRISDSASGEILLSYDELNRLVRVATDQGTVEYAFDALGRRIRRTVNGTDATDITYDRANRVKSIAFRGRTATYEYDTAGRLTKKTLPNGMVQEYAWDEANRLTRIQYRKSDGMVIETLAYAYDANGDRIQKDSGASSVRETGFTAEYDEANRLTQLTLNPGAANAKTYALAYDENGSLVAKANLQDATDKTTYAWDAKNRLTAIQGPGLAASFKYDALGRRIERTVNAETVGYLYDGSQAIAELNGNAVVAAYHTGIDLDEVLARHAASGSRTLLQDALGSVIAQAREDQTIQNRYAYTPYGEVQSVGPDEENPLQYTGRENDRTGLYYYRARYYDPILKRFVSEDPIGLAGGTNLAAYVGGNPLSYIDPMGLGPLSRALASGASSGGSLGSLSGGGLDTVRVAVAPGIQILMLDCRVVPGRSLLAAALVQLLVVTRKAARPPISVKSRQRRMKKCVE